MTTSGFEELLDEFALDARERLRKVESLLLTFSAGESDDPTALVNLAKAELHTVKGNAGMMGFSELQTLAHAMEAGLVAEDTGAIDVSGVLKQLDEFRRALKKQGSADADDRGAAEQESVSVTDVAEGVRVPFKLLDELMDLLAETVIERTRVADVIGAGRRLQPGDPNYVAAARTAWRNVVDEYEIFGHTLDLLQERVLKLRLVPLSTLFGSLKRLVHDESRREGKTVALETSGGNVPLDKALLELANEALGHVVRNAVIHGIEAADVRRAAGKPPGGTIRVAASAMGDEVRLSVSDDGGGLDGDALMRTAKARGIDTTDLEDPYSLLFLSGFTTKQNVDLGAGRGVGLSAVRDAVFRQGGEITIDSVLGRGTAFHFRLPLSVSIARALMLLADGEEYALPLNAVVESQRLRRGDGHRVNNAGVFRWHDRTVPLLDLGHHFGTSSVIRDEGYVVVVEANGKNRGLLADEIRGIREIVVKALDPIVGEPLGIEGSTVLGDGRAILILDPRDLVNVEPFAKETV